MKTKEVEAISWIRKNIEWEGEQKDCINNNQWEHYRTAIDLGKVNKIIGLLKTKQELATNFSSEVEEQQKNLDQIDLWVMEIQELIKKIRGKI